MVAYVSTRGGAGERGFEDVLLAGLAEDGGLFVPSVWPRLDRDALMALRGKSYAETALAVIAPFVEGCFDRPTLKRLIDTAYASFKHPAVTPLVQIDADTWLLELFHGPTLAFKDVALQLLSLMFEDVLARSGKSITIVGATSGDTGSAAIAGCAGRERMRICILHPHERTSLVQRRQMTTVRAANVSNIAVEGTFDDCQALVKAMFADAPFRDDMRLAAVNSINWARIMAQVVYYVYAALRLGGPDRTATFVVPTGNFGDVYAGYVAQQMGLPIERLVLATNRNDILARFVATGSYRSGEVQPTISPSMDIQVASNFERLLFDIEGRDGDATRRKMASFAQSGELRVDEARLKPLRTLFASAAIGEATTKATMASIRATTGHVVDPHTAVAIAAAHATCSQAHGPVVVLATAHPAKFPAAVEQATGIKPPLPPHMADLFEREERFTILPADLHTIEAHVRGLGESSK